MKYDKTWWIVCFVVFDIRINQEMTKKHVKRIPPPNAAIPLRNPILKPPVSVRFGILLITWFRWDVMKYDKTWWIVCFVVFDIRINQEMTNKNVKRIPPPNAAIPLRNPILRTSRFCQIWDLLLSTWFRWDVMKYDKTWWIVCFVVFDIRINQEMTKQKCKKDTSSKCSHTLAEPHT